MATYKSFMAGNSGNAASSCQSGEVRAVHAKYAMAGTELSGDVIELIKLPGEHVVVDVIFRTAALGGSCAGHVGITSDDVGTTEDADAFIVGQSLATAAIARMSAITGPIVPAVANVRGLGLTLTANAAAGGNVQMTVMYRAKQSYDEVA